MQVPFAAHRAEQKDELYLKGRSLGSSYPKTYDPRGKKRLQGALENVEKCWKWSGEFKQEGEVRAKEMKWCKMEEMRGLIRKEEMGLVQGCPLSTFVLATYMMTTTCPPCRA